MQMTYQKVYFDIKTGASQDTLHFAMVVSKGASLKNERNSNGLQYLEMGGFYWLAIVPSKLPLNAPPRRI